MFGNRISVLIKLQSLRITSFHVQVWGKNKSPQARLERLNKPVNICALILLICLVILTTGACQPAEAQPSVNLTAEERQWLDRNQDKLNLLFNTEFPPIEFMSESGLFVGMGADVITIIEKRLGVKFNKLPSDDWNRHLAALERGECAIAPTIVSTPERQQYAFFTTPYATVPIIIITPRSIRGNLTLTDLKGLRVGVVSGYATEKYLHDQAIPGLKIITVQSVDEGLRNVSFGQLDAFVENLAVAAYYIDKEGIPNLRVAGTTDYTFAWSIGVSRKYPLLYTSIQKALDTITEDEMENIRKRWISLDVGIGLSTETIWKLKLGTFFALILLISLAAITIFLKHRLNQKVVSLRQSEQRYRDLVQNARAIILEWNTSGSITFFNEYAQKSFGYTEEEVLGKNVIGTIVPETDTGGKDLIAMIEAICLDPDAFRDNENENITKDGHRIWIRWSNRALYQNDQVVGILSIGSDITEFKQAEAINTSRLHLLQFAATNSLEDLLEETLNEAERITSSLIGFFHFINEDLRTINLKSWSTLTKEMFCKADNSSSHYSLDQGGVWVDCVHQRKPVIHNDYASLPGRKGTPEGHAKVIRELVVPVFRDDKIKAVLGIGNKPTDYDDRDVAIITKLADLAWDIAEHKRIVEKHRLLEERLQRAEKMEALGLLSGGVAHDLNNVLGIIIGFSELLLLKLDESSPLKSYATRIMDASERASATIQDMLTLARRGVQAKKVVNVNTLIADFFQSPEFENIKKMHPSVHLETHLEVEPLHIMGTPHQLLKTISNLVSNAFEAMQNGGILSITTANQYLDSPIQGYDEVLEGDYVVLSVSDSGIGISTRDINHIFEPFYTKKVMGQSGTGLGLAVVWGAVKDHNGYIDVRSEEGKGSTFTLYLPVTREEIETETQAVSLNDYLGRGETVLVVDDVEGQRNLAAEMLKRINYNVTVAASGEEAVAYVTKHPVDILVLDMIMDPGMDGLDTYRSILEINPQQKAVIVSGFSDTDRVRTAQSLGAGPYVKKPYILEKLGLAVRKELDRKVDSRVSGTPTVNH